MGAEQSTPGEGPTAGAAEETKAEGIEKPKPPTAMSHDQKSTQAVLAGMEGVMARVPAEKISSGATIQDLALNLPTPGTCESEYALSVKPGANASPYMHVPCVMRCRLWDGQRTPVAVCRVWTVAARDVARVSPRRVGARQNVSSARRERVDAG